MDDYILTYYQGITDGSIVVGKWVRMLYEKIIHGIEDGTYIYNRKKAHNAIAFIEHYVRHNKGALAPGALKLSLWQKAALQIIYGIVDENGNRQFREIFMLVGRKCGKTLLASAVIAYEAYLDGEYGQEIYCLAPKLDQSDLVYSAFEFTVNANAGMGELTEFRGRKADIFIPSRNTTIKKIAFDEKRAEGYSPQLVICDELASWIPARGLKMYEAMVSGTGARSQPLILSISSSGYVNEGIFDELYKRQTRFLMGESKEEKLLPFLYQIDDPKKWDDINEMRKALPGLGVSVSTDFILEEIRIAQTSLSKKNEFLVKYAGIKASSSLAWLKSTDIERACGKPITPEQMRHSYCLAGLDLSMTTDLTAACLIIQKKDDIYVIAHFWLPGAKIEEATIRDGIPYQTYIERGFLSPSGENFIDYRDCFNWLVEMVEKYELLPLQVGYDKYSAQYLIQDLRNYGFQCDDVYQGFNMTPALRTIEGLLGDGRLHIGDNDLLKLHMFDAAVKRDIQQGKIKLIKLKPTAHIDGVAALADAFIVRDKWWSQYSEQLQNREKREG